MIEAGTPNQICWERENWIFLDIGFSEKRRSSGLLVGEGKPKCLRFSEARKEVKEAVHALKKVNLVIEAPLSVCFDAAGNPSARSIEAEDGKSRCWYSGPGCAVMAASMYLLQDLKATRQGSSVRLFEGFVSYKETKKTSHEDDVLALRHVIQNLSEHQAAIFGDQQLKRRQSDHLFSAFRVIGLDCGVPTVIKPRIGA